MKAIHLAVFVGGLALLPLQNPNQLRAQSQAAAGSPAFEVASVKPSTSGGGAAGGCHGVDYRSRPDERAAPPLGRCVITDARLSHLIAIAYELPSMQVFKGGQDWVAMGDNRYNVEAKAEDPAKATQQELLSMLQNLLVDRFQLKFHRENVGKPGFSLVVAKNGPKLQPAQGDKTITSFAGGPNGVNKPIPGQPIALTARKYSMAGLASLLSQIGPGPVVDSTGLQGEYDFTLSWDESSSPSLSTALTEQLGLRFEPRKVPVSYFVVESAQKPTAN